MKFTLYYYINRLYNCNTLCTYRCVVYTIKHKVNILHTTTNTGVLYRVGKKAGNTHISQDGGKYWYLPGNTWK